MSREIEGEPGEPQIKAEIAKREIEGQQAEPKVKAEVVKREIKQESFQSPVKKACPFAPESLAIT